MSDLELTKACALAMGLDIGNYSSDKYVLVAEKPQSILGLPVAPRTACSWFKYDPLHDDAQAMALVKRFDLWIGQSLKNLSKRVYAYTPIESDEPGYSYSENWDADLNRAIVECVAKIQADK